MYELTIRGITKQFESAAEMAEWQESMRSPKRFQTRENRVKNKQSDRPLERHLKKLPS
jgi:hypothetical protein